MSAIEVNGVELQYQTQPIDQTGVDQIILYPNNVDYLLSAKYTVNMYHTH